MAKGTPKYKKRGRARMPMPDTRKRKQRAHPDLPPSRNEMKHSRIETSTEKAENPGKHETHVYSHTYHPKREKKEQFTKLDRGGGKRLRSFPVPGKCCRRTAYTPSPPPATTVRGRRIEIKGRRTSADTDSSTKLTPRPHVLPPTVVALPLSPSPAMPSAEKTKYHHQRQRQRPRRV